MLKTVKFISLSLLSLALLLVLAACGGGGGGEEKKYSREDPADHTFEEKWSNDCFTHWHKDVCSDIHTGFRFYKDRAPHTIGADNLCTVCGYSSIADSGVNYQINEDAKSYTITGLSSSSKMYTHYYYGSDFALEPRDSYDEYVYEGYGVRYCEYLCLPSYHDGLPVTAIAPNAFKDSALQGELVIPATIGSIGEYAFAKCEGLRSIRIQKGSSLTSIEMAAFAQAGLRNFYIEENAALTEIGESAFSGCVSLVGIDLSACSQLERISRNAFHNATLKTIHLPASLKALGVDAFADTNLETVIIDSLAAWCELDFASKTASPLQSDKTKLQFHGVTVNEGALTIPANVKKIGSFAFCGNTGITSLVIPENSALTEIGASAFEGCTGLTALTLAPTIATVAEDAFSGCPIGTATLTAAQLPLLQKIQKDRLTELTVTKGTEISGLHSFVKLRKVTLPEGVTAIKENAFVHCLSLAEINFPASLTTIEPYAFRNCPELVPPAFPATALTIGKEAFALCKKLTEVKLTSLVSSVAEDAFVDSGLITAEVPAHLLSAVNVTTLKNLIITEGNFLELSAAAISTHTVPRYQKSLETVTLPNSIVRIGDYVFQNCKNLRTFTMSRNIEDIAPTAFRGCRVSEATKWGGGLYLPSDTNAHLVFVGLEDPEDTYLGVHMDTRFVVGYACENARKLETVHFSNDLVFVGEGAFRGCTALTTLDFAKKDGWSEDIYADSPVYLDLSDTAEAAALFRSSTPPATIRHAY